MTDSIFEAHFRLPSSAHQCFLYHNTLGFFRKVNCWCTC